MSVCRVHDTDALMGSMGDGISATHLFSSNYSNRAILQLKPVQIGTLTFLIFSDGMRLAYLSTIAITDKSLDASTIVPSIHICGTNFGTSPCIVNRFAVDDLNKRVFTGGDDGVWHCIDIETGKRIQQFQTHQGAVLDGDYCHGLLASGCEEGTVCVWDIRSQSCISAFDPASGKHLPLNLRQRSEQSSHTASYAVRFDKSGRYVVASSRRKRITAWNIRADSAQCSFDTEVCPYKLDTAGDSIYFPSTDSRIWRYSMYHAQMQCFHSSIARICDLHIDREQQETLLVSGSGESIEMLSLDGASLGTAHGRSEPSPSETSPLFSPPPFGSHYDEFGQGEEPPSYEPYSTPPYSPEIDEICDSGSEMVTDEEEEIFESESSISPGYNYYAVDGDIQFSTEDDERCSMYDEDEPMDAIDMDHRTHRFGFARLPAYDFISDSDPSPRDVLGMPSGQEYSNCEFSSSQEDSDASSEEEME